MKSSVNYRVYGLTVCTDLPLDLQSLDSEAEAPDLVIIRDRLPDGLPRDEGVHAVTCGDLLCVPGVARYLCRGGSEIIVEPCHGVSGRNIRLFLLGSAMGLVLHQRGLLALHANAIAIGGEALSFIGQSGAGKSTLAAWCTREGYTVVSDDVCAISFDNGEKPIVHPGLPRVRLWRDALERLAFEAADFPRSFDEPGYEKYDVALEQSQFTCAGLPLRAVSLLEEGQGPTVSRLTGVDAVEALYSHTYRGEHLGGRSRQAHWQSCMLLARNTPILRVSRPKDSMNLEPHTREILSKVLSFTQ